MPTEVCAGAVVAGYGPPWCMPWVTATPVGKPSKISRPLRSPSAVGQQRDQLRVLGLRVDRARELAVDAQQRVEQLVARAVGQQQDDGPEALLEQLGVLAHVARRRAVGRGAEAEARLGGRRGAVDGLGQPAELGDPLRSARRAGAR